MPPNEYVYICRIGELANVNSGLVMLYKVSDCEKMLGRKQNATLDKKRSGAQEKVDFLPDPRIISPQNKDALPSSVCSCTLLAHGSTQSSRT